MRLIKTFVAALLLNLSQPLKAGEETESPRSPGKNPVLMALLFEGMIGVNAWMASKNPHAYGALGALLFPLAGAGDGALDTTTEWVMLGTAEAIAFYNIGIDEDEKSEKEIFRDNFKAWHGFAAVGLVTAYLTGDYKKKPGNASLSFIPINDGAHFMLSYKF